MARRSRWPSPWRRSACPCPDAACWWGSVLRLGRGFVQVGSHILPPSCSRLRRYPHCRSDSDTHPALMFQRPHRSHVAPFSLFAGGATPVANRLAYSTLSFRARTVYRSSSPHSRFTRHAGRASLAATDRASPARLPIPLTCPTNLISGVRIRHAFAVLRFPRRRAPFCLRAGHHLQSSDTS